MKATKYEGNCGHIFALLVLLAGCLVLARNADFIPRAEAGVTLQTEGEGDESPYCPPGQKCWSGVHLGNRLVSGNDWASPLLNRIDPVRGGAWPRAIVVLSEQVYTVNRTPQPNCFIVSATVSSNRYSALSYLKRAALAGVKVIIRVYPSPGNFEDWDSPNDKGRYVDHHSVLYPFGSRCDFGAGGAPGHRDPGDVAAEIVAIHDYNVSQGFNEFAFEPANEPNVDARWYGLSDLPTLTQHDAWWQMDAYFSLVYDTAHAHGRPNLRILTPPMAPNAYAERVNVQDLSTPCSPMLLADWPGSGYEAMDNYYQGYHDDGLSWHNYWDAGYEAAASCPAGQHVSLYFSTTMYRAIFLMHKPQLITEADLYSPKQQPWGPGLPNKDDGLNARKAAESIRWFFYSERAYWNPTANRLDPITVSWLLSDNTGCENSPDPCDHPFHEAYVEEEIPTWEREWFRRWYTGNDSP